MSWKLNAWEFFKKNPSTRHYNEYDDYINYTYSQRTKAGARFTSKNKKYKTEKKVN